MRQMIKLVLTFMLASIATVAKAEVVIQTKSIVVEYGIAKFIVIATNRGEGDETAVIATCTVFDKDGEPLGTGTQTFNSIKAGEKVYGTAYVEIISKGTPASSACRQD